MAKLGRRLAPVVLLIGVAACGGSSDGGTGPGSGAGTMSAQIDGQSWSSDAQTTQAIESAQTPGTYVLEGTKVTAGNAASAVSISLILYNIRTTGTYAIGVGPTAVGGTATLLQGSTGFNTPLSGSAGTVTITALSANRIAGTFSFTAKPIVSGASSDQTVTSGQFDLTVTTQGGNIPPIPDQAGSVVAGQFNGSPWNAATIINLPFSNGVLTIGASTDLYSVTMILTGVTGPGTYAFTSVAGGSTIQVSSGTGGNNGSNCCWGSVTAVSGSVVITSLTATRVKGTLAASVPALGGGSAFTIANGTLDVGLTQP